MHGTTCTWAVFIWAVFAYGPLWGGPFLFGITWYLGRLHLKAECPTNSDLFVNLTLMLTEMLMLLYLPIPNS